MTQTDTPKTPSAIKVAVVSGLLALMAAPVHAGSLSDAFNCYFTSCGSSSGSGSSGSGSSGTGGVPGAPVAPTGRINVVYLVGSSFFPETIHAKPGDEIKFYNLANTTQRVRADDYSWQSDYLSKNQSWSMIVTPNTQLMFRKSGYGTFYGEIKLEPLPEAVAFGDLIDGYGNVIGKDGSTVKYATGLGSTLASVGGLIQDTGTPIMGIVGQGSGLALGLTETLGLGNNTGTSNSGTGSSSSGSGS